MKASYPTYKSTPIPWLPEIPEHWDLLPIRAILAERGERNDSIKTEFILSVLKDRGVIPYTEKGNVGNKMSERIDKYKIVHPNDLVINKMNAIIGSLGLSKYYGALSQVYFVLKRRRATDNPRFLAYLFQSKEFQPFLSTISSGIMELRESIDKTKFNALKLPLPPLTEQTAIANYLDTKIEQINRFIAKKERMIALLKEQKQAIINELLEDKERKWERMKLKFVGKMINGFAFSSEEFLIDGNVKVIKIANIQPMRMDWIEKSFIAESYYEMLKQFSVNRGDLVFALTRPIIKEGIKVAFIDTDEKLLVNQRNAILKPRKNVTKDWLYYCFLASQFVSEFDKKIDRTGQQPNISTEDIGNIKIPFPPLDVQNSVVKTIKVETNKLDSVITQIEKEIEKVKELKQSLITEVVTGRIKVV